MSADTIMPAIGIAAGALAVGFSLGASFVPVPDNIDTFIGALQRANQLSQYGAFSAAVSVVCQAYTFYRRANR